MCDFDYAHKHTENEEDERAAMYRYLRNEMDKADLNNKLRVFLSYSFKVGNQKLKPDILIVSHEDNYNNLKTEAIIEMKNWPTKRAIIADLKKLERYSQTLAPETPSLYFFAIIGYKIKNNDIDTHIKEIQTKIGSNINIVLRHHGGLYKGPWYKDLNTDPWRYKYRR